MELRGAGGGNMPKGAGCSDAVCTDTTVVL